MKTVEHIKGMSACQHRGREWADAIAGAVKCLGTRASLNDYIEMGRSFTKGQAVWHRGHLLTGRSS